MCLGGLLIFQFVSFYYVVLKNHNENVNLIVKTTPASYLFCIFADYFSIDYAR